MPARVIDGKLTSRASNPNSRCRSTEHHPSIGVGAGEGEEIGPCGMESEINQSKSVDICARDQSQTSDRHIVQEMIATTVSVPLDAAQRVVEADAR